MINLKRIIKNDNGFSLMELMLSMAIIVVALVSIIGLFISLFRSSQKGMDLTNGMIVAETVLNQYLYDKQGMLGGLYGNLIENVADPETGTTSDSELYGEDFKSRTIYTYEIICRDVKNSPPKDLKKIDVTVTWWRDPDKEGEYKSGYGRLVVKLSRLVYTSDELEVIPEF